MPAGSGAQLAVAVSRAGAAGATGGGGIGGATGSGGAGMDGGGLDGPSGSAGTGGDMSGPVAGSAACAEVFSPDQLLNLQFQVAAGDWSALLADTTYER